MKNTQAHVKKNPVVQLQTDLPPRGRQNQAIKGAQNQRGSHSQEQATRNENPQHLADERESSSRNSKSHHGLFEDDFFDTPQVLYQERVLQQDTSNLNDRDHDNPLQHKKGPPMLDSSLKRTRSRHLELECYSDERISSSDFTIPDPNEIDLLRMQLAEKEAIDKRL